jgi:hypothetical protein
VSARFGAGSLPGDVRAVRPHGQDHCIAIARPSEDHSWPLLLHHPPFGASARDVNGLTRARTAVMRSPGPRTSAENAGTSRHGAAGSRKSHREWPETGRQAALVVRASRSPTHAQGGGIWPDGTGMPDPSRKRPTNPAHEPSMLVS